MLPDHYKTIMIATRMYEHMFYNLVESVSNCSKTCEGASYYTEGQNYYYLQGKADAYKEVANRILKEMEMSKRSFFDDRKCNAVLAKIFHGSQIESLDAVIPDDRVRGNTLEFHKKQLLVQAFSQEMMASFILGMKFEELRKKPEYKRMSEQELFEALLESRGFTKEIMEFLDRRYQLQNAIENEQQENDRERNENAPNE